MTLLATNTRAAWLRLHYQGYGLCAHCGEQDYCCGLNPSSRICLGCFEFLFSGRPPNMRRRKSQGARA